MSVKKMLDRIIYLIFGYCNGFLLYIASVIHIAYNSYKLYNNITAIQIR